MRRGDRGAARGARRRARWGTAALLAATLAGCAGDPDLAPDAPFAIGVTSFSPGERAGFGQDLLPDVVLGPPRGLGDLVGSLDVLSLGVEGTVTVELGRDAVDGPGPDLIIFENAFHVGGGPTIFSEPGIVALSADGVTFVEVPCALDDPGHAGCAGANPVYANADDNDIDPRDPGSAGGDAFDLAEVGLPRARFVRIRDSGLTAAFGTDNAGFDLDAVAVVHGD